jgi:hypothetical protein
MPAIVASALVLLLAAQAVFGKIWTPNDLALLQAQLLTQANNLNTAVAACTTLGSDVKTAWATDFARFKTFAETQYGWITNESAGSTSFGGVTKGVADQAVLITQQLYDWARDIQSLGCTLNAPIQNPNPPQPPAQWPVALKYAAIAAGFVGTAYAVGQIASTVRLFESRSTKELPSG